MGLPVVGIAYVVHSPVVLTRLCVPYSRRAIHGQQARHAEVQVNLGLGCLLGSQKRITRLFGSGIGRTR